MADGVGWRSRKAVETDGSERERGNIGGVGRYKETVASLAPRQTPLTLNLTTLVRAFLSVFFV